MNYHELEKDMTIREQYNKWDAQFMDEPIRVAICIPTYDMKVQVQTMVSLATMWKPTHYYKYSHGPTIDVNRNRLVENALIDPHTTHILFVDTDMILPHNLLGRFLMHMEDDESIMAMSGIYFQKAIPYRCTQFVMWGSETFRRLRTTDYPEGDLVGIDAAGAGALLIKREAFSHLSPPFFQFELLNYGSQYLGEDIHFFKKMQVAGLKTCVDTSIICQHIDGRMTVPLMFDEGYLEVGEKSKKLTEKQERAIQWLEA